jgi:hypothetical protein
MRFRNLALAVVAYAAAMAYLESAVVVYLQRALSITPAQLFPLQNPGAVGDLAAIEVGREFATMVMLVMVGVIAGRRWTDRLAWTAVAFGVWDILYYAWLWVFIGWPTSPGTWDILFLIPLPWAGPVWAPITVSLALVGFGLAAAHAVGCGRGPVVRPAAAAAALLGGGLVVLSFTLQGPALLDGALPGAFAWPVFVAGMAVAAGAAAWSLWLGGQPSAPSSRPAGAVAGEHGTPAA